MRCVEIHSLDGPDGVVVVERDEPDGPGIIVDVVCAGVSFPDLLQTRGLYQIRPEPPFRPGLEAAGVVRRAPEGSGYAAGDRVMVWSGGCLAEVVHAHAGSVFALPEAFDFAQGAAFILNYQTAVFCLEDRGRLTAGESVLVLGASGGVGTAAIEVARSIGADPIIGLVSTPAKAAMASAAGAHHTVVVSDTWKDEVLALTDGRGVDLVYDPVGGDRFLDGIRSLARFGRLVVVGFAAGQIPEIKVNRLLLRNVSVVGAAWGEAVAQDAELAPRLHRRLLDLVATGHIHPPVGHEVDLDDAAEAYRLLDTRQAVGKVVVRMRPDPTS